ncbi:hypothetical protein FB451DRAFT_1414765 [Mycena latifolia]|nr:hypothetical protein FB451DRAFT_1414765 [Mycena latifolia]
MLYKKLGTSVPFLKFSKSSEAYEERPSEGAPRKPRLRCMPPLWGSKIMAWPTAAILGQLVLHVLGWGFFVVNNSHSVTLLATVISTMLAGFSSFLFSYAIRRSVVIYLYRPMSLGTLGASVSISMRSVVFHRRD